MKHTDFIELLEATKKAFDLSDIKAFAEKEKKAWHYAVTATPIKSHRLLLLGFNWGASAGVNYGPQAELPQKGFMEMDNNDLGSFKRVKSYLKRYCPDDLEEVGQSNFCFFRSASDGQISSRDLLESTPLFEKMLQMTPPKEILGFSSRLREHWMASDWFRVFREAELPYKRGGKDYSCKVVKGSYQIEGRAVPVSLLPHPNSPLPGEIREQAWAFCFGG